VLQRSERIYSLILEGCPALVEGMVVPPFMKSLTYPVLRWLIPYLPTSKSYARKILREIGHTYAVKNGYIPEHFVEWYVALSNHTDTMKHEVAAINQFLVGGEMQPEYLMHDTDIQKITIPTLWLWGTDDPFGGVALGKRIHERMPHSEFVVFEHSGHLPWIDKPEAHADHIGQFVREYSHKPA